MALRAVLFDLDDTLFDHTYSTLDALSALQGVYSWLRAWPLDELASRHSRLLERLHLDVLAGRLGIENARIRRFTELAAESGTAVVPDEAAAVAADYRRAYVAAWRPVPGAMALLEALHPRAPIGVVSNNVVGEQLDKITLCGLARYLDTVVISEEAGVAKPDPRVFDIALARLGASADETVMVGDSWATDIAGARAAGMRAVWFNRRALPRPGPGAVTELRSLEPVATAIELILGDS